MKSKKDTKYLMIFAAIFIGILILQGIANSKREPEVVEKVVYKEKSTKSVSDIRKNENIVFLGDSITDFYPIDSIYHDLPIIKSGVSGYKTKDILERMDSLVYQYNPTSVFLLIGTNDVMFDETTAKEKAIKNIETIISNIQENRKKAQIYLESIYPVNQSVSPSMVLQRNNETIKEMNHTLKEYCDSHNVIYIDMFNELKDANGNFDAKYTNDGLHPNDLGYARISQVRSAYIFGIELNEKE